MSLGVEFVLLCIFVVILGLATGLAIGLIAAHFKK